MTTVVFVQKNCFICDTRNRYPDFGLITLGKPEDLDGRTGGTSRSTVYMLMQQCTSCGYCSPDISSGPSQAKNFIEEAEYKKQLTDLSYPQTARFFLCWSIIQNQSGILHEAGQASLYATWICDDDNNYRQKAIECRNLTIDYFQKARTLGLKFAVTNIEEQLILIDLLRRNGRFKEAMEICKEESQKPYDEREELLLMYQEELIEDKSTKRHTIYDALNT